MATDKSRNPKRTKRITIQEFAAKHDVAPRKVRRHTRSLGLGVGRGKRYGLTAQDAKRLRKSLGL